MKNTTTENRPPLLYDDAVVKVLRLCFDIQNKNIATCFFELSGHVAGIAVRVFYPTWESGNDPDKKVEFYIDEECSEESINKKISLLEDIFQRGTTSDELMERNRQKVAE